jgi:hypothetical protein
MPVETLLLLLVFIVIPLLERLARWFRERAEQAPKPTQTPGERAKPVEVPRPAEAPRRVPVPQPARRGTEVLPDRHEPVWNDAEWRYPPLTAQPSEAGEAPRPMEGPPPAPPPARVPEAPREGPRTAKPGPRQPRPGTGGRSPDGGRQPGRRRVPVEPPPAPAGRRPPVYDTWREAEARTLAVLPVEAGDLTSAENEAVVVPPAARRANPARQLGLTSRSELRRAMVLLTVLGPCKANEA